MSDRKTWWARWRLHPRSAIMALILGSDGLPPRLPFSRAAAAFVTVDTLPALLAMAVRSIVGFFMAIKSRAVRRPAGRVTTPTRSDPLESGWGRLINHAVLIHFDGFLERCAVLVGGAILNVFVVHRLTEGDDLIVGVDFGCEGVARGDVLDDLDFHCFSPCGWLPPLMI